MTNTERSQARVIIEDSLHQSMEEGEEAIQLASGMNKKMATFVQAREVSVKYYEEKLAILKDELNQVALSKEELSSALYLLKEENTAPRAALEESHEAKEYYNQELIDFNLD